MRSIDSIIKLDVTISLFCLQNRFSPSMARVSKAISHTGDGHLYVVIALIAWGYDTTHGTTFALAGLTAFAMELPIYWALKNGFKRRRPQELSLNLFTYITPSDQYSLPSGHTAAAFLMAVLLSHFYPACTGYAYFWALLIASSRVLLGVHFVTDVALGAVLGMTCAYLALIGLGV
ncbi:phosphatase PAP2 family protein [Vibrio sp. TRT 21S02]|uniref:phosphatase PAP2 family protein n=1 Tax=Vibrio sp. TRT 21S02 TaxID=3418507 RepID=UPI003CF15025